MQRLRAPVAFLTLTAFCASLVAPFNAAAQTATEGREPGPSEVVQGTPVEPSPPSPAENAEPELEQVDPADLERQQEVDPKAVQAAADAATRAAPKADPVDTASLPTGDDKSGVTSKAISVPKGAGSVKGMEESFSAQLSTGIATYSVGFALPTARGAVDPELGLSYSSAGGHGTAGVGWNVGVSFIARQTDRGIPKYNTDGTFHADQDRFVFNGGQELVPICDIDTARQCAGALPGEVMPAWSAGWQYYRPRVEGGFMRFFLSGDGRTWRVQSKEGSTLELGVALDGQNDLQALEQNPEAPAEIYRWNLRREYDTYVASNGQPVNVVYYGYTHDGATAYLTDIYDTTPVDDPTTLSFSRYAHHTRLVWEARTDPTFSYRSGWRMEQNLRLARVDVTSASYGNETRELVRRYELDYDPNYHVSLLRSVTLVGRCQGQSVPEASGSLPAVLPCTPDVLPPTEFDYSHAGFPTSDGFEQLSNDVRPLLGSPPHSVDEQYTDLFDVNSDGLPDVLVTSPGQYGSGHGVFFNGAGGELETFGNVEPMALEGVLGATPSTLALSNPNLVPLDLDGDGSINFLHMPQVKTYATYSPVHTASGWKWEGRVVKTASGLDPLIDFTNDGAETQVMDVDFDGLVDVVVSSGSAMRTFFNLGRLPHGDGQFGFGTQTGPLSADLGNDPVETCLPWSSTPVRFSDGDVKTADMNGDGIVDLVRVRQGQLQYWPGRGNGFWGTGSRSDCHGGGFGTSRHLEMANAPVYSDIQGDSMRMEDVNGDGFTDLIQVRSSEVDVWFNVDGRSWTARRIITGTPDSPSFAKRVRLVDVDGSGTRDILWGDGGNYRYVDLLGGTRPWILTEVKNGLGKTTTLEYTSSIDEMLAAERDGNPWSSKAPMVLHLVKRMTESDNLNVYGQGARTYTTEYSYRDPVYDGRQREFRGFREATSKSVGDANSPTSIARSTFLLGECLLEDGSPCPNTEPWLDNPHEALKGLPVLSETFDESGVYLSTAHNQYTLRRLYQGLDGRGVVYAFSNASTSWAYDTASFVPSSSVLKDQLTVTAEGLGVSPSVRTDIPIRASTGTVRTHGETTVDDFGNQLTGTSFGCVSGCPAGATDEAITGVSEPVLLDHPSGWLWRTATSYTVGSVHTQRRGETTTSYTAEGNPDLVTAVLTGTEALQRFHAAGGVVAPTPGDAVSDTSALYVSETDYDDFGNAIRSYAPGGRCADVFLDPLYAQLATTEMMYPSGCPVRRSLASPPPDTLYSAASYDRGLELVTHVIDVTFQTTQVEYDGLGRLTRLFRSEPDGAGLGVLPSVEIDYDLATDARPYSVIHTRSQDGATTGTDAYMESYAYVDGLGRTLVGITEADPTANDEGDWIAGGFVDYDRKGAVSKKYLPKFWSGNPRAFDLTQPPGTPFGRVEYDAFGRDLRLYDLDDTQTLLNVYHALSSDAWDAADREAGGPHAGTFVTSVSDGHGRGVLGIERFKENGTLIHRETRTTFLPTGEPVTITRSSTHGSTTRWLRYDSLGRMVLNVEPHTSEGFDPDPNADATNIKAWRYRYNGSGELVGTSDARGCGVNFQYDGVGRLLYEDYSPCDASHQAYSPASLAGSAPTGVEVFYQYDRAPNAALGVPQVPSGSGTSDTFTPQGSGDFLRGKLVAVYDRAKTTWTNYDGRSRAFESWVRLAAPGVPDDALGARYGGRWYRKQVSFDGADRVITETTGAQSPELMGSDGQSRVDIAYSGRGTVRSVAGSYGALVTDIKRTADGLHQHIEYGDLAATRTQFSYDPRRRLASVQTYRGPPAAWSDPSSSYSHAGTGGDTFQKVLQDDRYHYDIVSNPLLIEDLRNPDEWPVGAKPVTRTMQYDDLYRDTRVDYGYSERDDSIVPPAAIPAPSGVGPAGALTRATPRISAEQIARFHQATAERPRLSGTQAGRSKLTVQGIGPLPSNPPPPSPPEGQPEDGEKAERLEASPSVRGSQLIQQLSPRFDLSGLGSLTPIGVANQLAPTGLVGAPFAIQWEHDPTELSYDLSISDGASEVFTTQITATSASCDLLGQPCSFEGVNLGPGQYTWRVRSIDAQGTPDAWSTDLPFSVDASAPTPLFPAAELSEARPSFVFTAQPAATQYELTLVDGAGRETLVVPAGLAGSCSSGRCAIDAPRDVAPGAALWSIRAEIGGTWTSPLGLAFSRGPIAPLGAVTPQAPSAQVAPPVSYQWSADPGAQGYELEVRDALGSTLFTLDVPTADAGCNAGQPSCSLTPAQATGLGDFSWRVRATNVIGDVGPWTPLTAFSVSQLPTAPTILAPIGTLHDSVPVYSWTGQGNVTSYELRVTDSLGGVWSETVSAADASCTAASCSFTPAHVLSTGGHTVWVRGLNAYGEGPWSTPEQFYLVANATGRDDAWDDPNADPSGDQRRAEPSPYQEFENRIRYQTWDYDWLGNTTETDDDAKGFYDRSLGDIENGALGGEAYQLKGASNRSSASTRQGDLRASYDVTGNLTELRVDRDGTCIPSGKCSQVFRYQWDEVGRLVTAKRWDAASLDVSSTTDPVGVADVELHYGYDASDMRVSKRAVDTQGEESNTLYIFGSLELRRTTWTAQDQDYALNPETEVTYLFANGVRLARLAYEAPGDVPSINGENLHVFFELGDHLGSTSVVLDKATGELVERSTYQAYGGSESDYRPERWKNFREDYRFTGKEEDVEVGLIYFGKRFLNPLLNRWVSADPLGIVAWDQTDLNLYAYVSGRALLNTDPIGLQATPNESPKIAPQPKGLPPKTKAPGTPRPKIQTPKPKQVKFPSTGTGTRIWLPPAWLGPAVVFVGIMIQPQGTATNDQEEINAKGVPKKYYRKHKGKNMPLWENQNTVKIEHYEDGTWLLKFRMYSKRQRKEREFWVRYDKKGRLSGNTAHIHHDDGVQYVPIGNSRDADANAANTQRGKPQPTGWVWHHAGIVKINGVRMYRMELWDADVHETATHAGAYSDAKADRGESKASRRRKPTEKK